MVNYMIDPATKRQVVVERFFGYPSVVEASPIELAKVPLNGNDPTKFLFFHPRYVPKDIDHEVKSFRVYRRGRTIDVFFDEPLQRNGKWLPALNYKGVGANAERDLVIHPTLWYGKKKGWAPPRAGENRKYGAVTTGMGIAEYNDNVFSSHGLPLVDHISMNPFPEGILRQIEKVEGQPIEGLSQLVRGHSTNIRIDMKDLLSKEDRDALISPESYADIDSDFATAQLGLLARRKAIKVGGDIVGNRMFDGVFTDAENYVESEVNSQSPTIHSIAKVMAGTLALLDPGQSAHYLATVQRRTRLPVADKRYAPHDVYELAIAVEDFLK